MPLDPSGNLESILFKWTPILLSVASFIESFILGPRRAKARGDAEKLADGICRRLDQLEILLPNYWSKLLKKPDSKTRDADKILSHSITQCLDNINTELTALYRTKGELKPECQRLIEEIHEFATSGKFQQESRDPDHDRVKMCNTRICKLRKKLLPGEF